MEQVYYWATISTKSKIEGFEIEETFLLDIHPLEYVLSQSKKIKSSRLELRKSIILISFGLLTLEEYEKFSKI